MKEALQALQDYFEDPVKVQEMIDHFKRREERRKHNMSRMMKFFRDDKSFDDLIFRVVEKHDKRWDDLCHARGVMPYPWNILYSIYDIVEMYGKETKPVDGLTRSFPSVLITYRGWTFARTHGQGTVMSIYKGNDLIYRD
jgi:hypothetical protein